MCFLFLMCKFPLKGTTFQMNNTINCYTQSCVQGICIQMSNMLFVIKLLQKLIQFTTGKGEWSLHTLQQASWLLTANILIYDVNLSSDDQSVSKLVSLLATT